MVCLLALLVGGVVYCIVPRTYIASGIQCSGDYTARGIEWFMTSLFLGGTLLAAYIAVEWLMSSLFLGNKMLVAYSAVARLQMFSTWYKSCNYSKVQLKQANTLCT